MKKVTLTIQLDGEVYERIKKQFNDLKSKLPHEKIGTVEEYISSFIEAMPDTSNIGEKISKIAEQMKNLDPSLFNTDVFDDMFGGKDSFDETTPKKPTNKKN